MNSNSNTSFDHNSGWQSEQVAKKYDERRFTSFFGRAFDRAEKNALATVLSEAESQQPIKTVLDLPCGTGRISEFLLRRGYDLECADISKEMIDVAQSRLAGIGGNDVKYTVMDIYNIDRPDATYDCVSCIRLFQHLDSDERARALKELGRVSKRYLVVNVMYTSLYYGLVRKLRLALGRYAPRFTCSQQQLQTELEFAGLRVVKSIFSQPYFGGNLVLLLEKK